MLTVEEYEQYQNKMKDLEVQINVLQKQQAQMVERLKNEYGLTPLEAAQKIEELRKTLPQKEADFEQRFEEFKKQCELLEQN